MIDPNATAAWELLSTTSNIIDGKYFLAGTQANATNAFADCYAAGSSKWTSRQFQFDAGVNVEGTLIQCYVCCRLCHFLLHFF